MGDLEPKGQGRKNSGEGTDDDLKVNDRRLFNSDGQLREALDESDSDSESVKAGEESGEGRRDVASPDETPNAADTTPGETEFQRRPLDEPEGVDFMMLINAMAQPALIFLGETAHPGSGKPEVNLEQARLQIDLLDILRIKCRGNMTPEEEGVLDRLLYQLRMLYVARSGEQGN